MTLSENTSGLSWAEQQREDPHAIDPRLMLHVRQSVAAVTQHNRATHAFHDADLADARAEEYRLREWAQSL